MMQLPETFFHSLIITYALSNNHKIINHWYVPIFVFLKWGKFWNANNQFLYEMSLCKTENKIEKNHLKNNHYFIMVVQEIFFIQGI